MINIGKQRALGIANREKIINLLLKRQEEVLYHYLNNEERKKYKINIKTDKGRSR